MKKLLAVTISAMMVMTMVPSMAFANVEGTPDASGGNTDTSTEQQVETTTPSQPEATVATKLPDKDASGVITLTSDVELENTHVFLDGKNVINLNGFNILAKDCRAIKVKGGSLLITGKGTIKSVKTSALVPENCVIMAGDAAATEPVSLVIDSEVVVEAPDTYGVVGFGATQETVTVKGTINAGPKAALSGNGSDLTGANFIVEPTAKLKSDQYAGIYNPQNGKLTINGGEITGVTGIEMRAGSLEVNGGVITATANEVAVTPSGSGFTTKGAGIAIAQHTTQLPISVTVNGGKIVGAAAVNHANPQQNSDESLKNINIAIKDGEFIGNNNNPPIVTDKKDVISISGGKFSQKVDDSLLAGGVTQDSNGNVYVPSYGGGAAPVDPMETVKKDAVSALEGFVKLENYDAEEQAVIKSLVEKAKAEISKAATKEAIAKIEADTKAEIAKVKTTADKVLAQKISEVKEVKLYAKTKVIKAKSGKKVVKLAWKAKSGDITKLDGVQVFRSTKGKVGTFKKVYTGKNGKFINKSVVKGQKYFYKVRGFAKIDGKTYYTKFSVKKVGRV